jgi:hypothetical protein
MLFEYKKTKIPFRFKDANNCDINERLVETSKKLRWTYRRQEFSDSCNQEPNDTLSDRNHISGRRVTTLHKTRCQLTCFQRTRPSSNQPSLPLRSCNKPTSMMRIRATSVANVTMNADLLLSAFCGVQACCSGSQVE